MQLNLGNSLELELEPIESNFRLPTLQVYLCDQLANLYQPIIYGSEYSLPPPEGIYYRIMYNSLNQEFCIQYYVYWFDQNCMGIIPLADHKYDYEPILIFLKPPSLFPVGVVNAGYSKYLGIHCRFHKTEIRRMEFNERDQHETNFNYFTSRSPYYPFGGPKGRASKTCVKRYPLSGSLYFEETRPLFSLISCSHVFSGAEASIRGERLDLILRPLSDATVEEWYGHFGKDEEPFGHDISDPFSYPYIKYFDPK